MYICGFPLNRVYYSPSYIDILIYSFSYFMDLFQLRLQQAGIQKCRANADNKQGVHE